MLGCKGCMCMCIMRWQVWPQMNAAIRVSQADTCCRNASALQAWVTPLRVAAVMRGVGGDAENKVSAWLAKRINHLQHTEALLPAVTKLVLAAISAAPVWCTMLCVCSVEFGDHTLLGWVWTLGVWKPKYTLQVCASTYECLGITALHFRGAKLLLGSPCAWTVCLTVRESCTEHATTGCAVGSVSSRMWL